MNVGKSWAVVLLGAMFPRVSANTRSQTVNFDYVDFAARLNKSYKNLESWRAHQDRFEQSWDAVEKLNMKESARAKKVNFELNFFADIFEEDLQSYFGNLNDVGLL